MFTATTSIPLSPLVMVLGSWKGLPLHESLAALTNPPAGPCMSLIEPRKRGRARKVRVVATFCTSVGDHPCEKEFQHITKRQQNSSDSTGNYRESD